MFSAANKNAPEPQVRNRAQARRGTGVPGAVSAATEFLLASRTGAGRWCDFSGTTGATEGWSDVPTCAEQGLAITQYEQPRTVWLPGKVSPEQAAFYVDLMKKVQATPEWKDYVEKSSQTSVFIAGDDLTKYMKEDSERVHKVAEEQGWLVGN